MPPVASGNHQLAKHRQGQRFTTGQRSSRSWTMFLSKALRLAKIINDHKQWSEKGSLVHQQRTPFHCEWDRQAHRRRQHTFISSPFYFTPMFKKKSIGKKRKLSCRILSSLCLVLIQTGEMITRIEKNTVVLLQRYDL